MDTIVGIMWNRNEEDILRFTISKALEQVDYLLLADDCSTDSSFEVMKEFEKHPKVAYLERVKKPNDKRKVLLDEVKRNFRHEDTLVQVIESDITILDTDIRSAWKKYASNDLSMCWYLINATDPNDWIDETGCYPTWATPIDKKMTHGHWIEEMSSYTFRPMPKVEFERLAIPWPQGFSKYGGVTSQAKFEDGVPLLAHWGHRGPTHWLKKHNPTGNPKAIHKKYNWPMGSVEKIRNNIPFFNGVWNSKIDCFVLNREGWKEWLMSPHRRF